MRTPFLLGQPRLARLIRIVAVAGGALLVAATFVPVNGGGRAGYPYAVYDTSVQRELQLFAAEPIAAAVLSVAAALFLLRRWLALTSGLLAAFGVQAGIFFLAHLGAATFGNPLYNSFRPGSLVGLAGAVMLVAAAALAFLASPPSRAAGLGRATRTPEDSRSRA
jgi:hypothetical protein